MLWSTTTDSVSGADVGKQAWVLVKLLHWRKLGFNRLGLGLGLGLGFF